MSMRCERTKPSTTIIFTLLALLSISTAHSNASPALDAFFSELDNNHDGAIDVLEASQFIGGSIGGQEFDEPQEATDAANSFLHSIDGGDAGLTVSVDELDVHLHSVLSGVRVWEWIRYGVGLPQYAEAFRAHSITPLDFPMLVQDNGRVLAEELGVSSPFHRSKVVRAIRCQILGLGQPPSEPQAVTCSTASAALTSTTESGGASGGRASIYWSTPAHPGVPPLHRYVLERAGADGQWRQVAELDDPEPAAVEVTLDASNPAPAPPASIGVDHPEGFAAGGELLRETALGASGRQVLYRVAAWNLYGRSAYGVAVCQLESVPPPGYPIAAEPGVANRTVGKVAGTETGIEVETLGPPREQVAAGGGVGGGPRCCGLSWAPPFTTAGVGPRLDDKLRSCDQAGVTEAEVDGVPRKRDLAQHAEGHTELRQAHLQQKPDESAGSGGTVRWHDLSNGGGSSDPAGAGEVALTRSPISESQPEFPRRPHDKLQDQGHGPGQRQPAAQPSRWWSTLLLVVLPWLLRLLPLWVLQAVGEGLQRLLLRAHVAFGWRPPTWLSQPTPGAEPSQLVQLAPLVPLDGLGSCVDGVGAGTRQAVGVGTGGASRGGGQWGSNTRALGAASALSALGGGSTAVDTVPAASAAAVAPGMCLWTGANWLDIIFPPAPPVAPRGTDTALVAPVAPPLYRSSLASDRPVAPSPSTVPHGTVACIAGGDAKGARQGSRSGGTAPNGLPQAAVPVPLPRGGSRLATCSDPPHRSTSEGDICGLEDSERPSTVQLDPYSHHRADSPHLQSALNPYQLAGSAPSLGQSFLCAAFGSQAGSLSRGTRGALREAETEGDLLAVAAAAGGSGDAGGVSGRGRGKMCAIPSCGRKLDLRHYRDYMRRHYCGRCQRTVCGQHTAYSPHGPTGSCDHVSRCVCTSCFTHFNPAYQLFLLKHNKLRPAGGVGPQAPVPSATGVAGLMPTQGQLDIKGDGSGGGVGSRHKNASGTGGSGAASGDDKSAAKLLWERAATKLKAVSRFRKKGAEGHGRELQVLDGIVE